MPKQDPKEKVKKLKQKLKEAEKKVKEADKQKAKLASAASKTPKKHKVKNGGGGSSSKRGGISAKPTAGALYSRLCEVENTNKAVQGVLAEVVKSLNGLNKNSVV